MAASKTYPGSQIQTVFNDAAANDSNKSFTVANRMRLQSAYVSLVASSDVGNRQLVLEVLDGANVVYQSAAGAVQAEDTTVVYNFAEGNARETAAVAGALDVPLACLHLQSGYSVRVRDSAAVAATADDMTVRIVAEIWQ